MRFEFATKVVKMWSSNMLAVDDTNSLQAYTAKKKKKNASESY